MPRVSNTFNPPTYPRFPGPVNPVTPYAYAAHSGNLQPFYMDVAGRIMVSASLSGSLGTTTIQGLGTTASGTGGIVTVQGASGGTAVSVVGKIESVPGNIATASGNALATALIAAGMLFNGVSLDIPRGTVNPPGAIQTLTTVLAGTSSSPDQTNFNGRGLEVWVNISAYSGSPSIRVDVQGKDPVSAAYYSIASTATTTIIGNGLLPLQVYPGIVEEAGRRKSATVPRTWRVQSVVASGASADGTLTATVSVGALV